MSTRMTPRGPALSLEDCRTFVREHVFRLRPTDYCEKYPQWPGMIGLELEMGVLSRATQQSVKPVICPLGGPNSLTEILTKLATAQGWDAVPTAGKNYLQLVRLNDNDQLTFEPGAQLEFSSKPYPCLTQALSRLSEIQGYLDKALAQDGYDIIQYGINPWLSVSEIGLQMNKPRYIAMDQYFSRIGPWGRRMMRQTCTVQVCLDFGGDEQTMAKRFLLGNLLAPVTTALFANSPMVDGQLSKYATVRGQCWREIDPSRTGLVALTRVAQDLSREACADAYADAVLAAKVIFIEALNFQSLDGSLSFADWVQHGFNGEAPTQHDFDTHLSLYFPEVRARGFLELRSVDCQARVFQAVPGAYYCGLLYDEQSLNQALELLLPYLPDMQALLNASSFGLADDRLAALAQKVMHIAVEGYLRLPNCYRDVATDLALSAFHERFTARRLTPADVIRQAISSGRSTATPHGLLQLYSEWVPK